MSAVNRPSVPVDGFKGVLINWLRCSDSMQERFGPYRASDDGIMLIRSDIEARCGEVFVARVVVHFDITCHLSSELACASFATDSTTVIVGSLRYRMA